MFRSLSKKLIEKISETSIVTNDSKVMNLKVNERYFCRLELLLNGKGVKETQGHSHLDQKFIDDVELYLLQHYLFPSESAFDCSKGRRNLDDDSELLHDDEARFVFNLTITDKRAFTGYLRAQLR